MPRGTKTKKSEKDKNITIATLIPEKDVPKITCEELFNFTNQIYLKMYYDHQLYVRNIYNIGSRLSGKTHGVLEFIERVWLTVTNSVIYIVRKKVGQLNKMKTQIFNGLNKKGYKVEQGKDMKGGDVNELTNNGLIGRSGFLNKIIFQGINDEKIKEEQGGEVGGTTWEDADFIICMFEECTQLNERQLRVFKDTVRGGPQTKYLYIYNANPWSAKSWYPKFMNEHLPENRYEMETKGYQCKFDWEYFINPITGEVETNGLSIWTRSSVSINPFVPQEKKNELMALKEVDENAYNIAYLGLSGVPEGALYSKGLQTMTRKFPVEYTDYIYNDDLDFPVVLQCGIDWGDGITDKASPTTAHIGLLSIEKGLQIFDELTIYNNKGTQYTTDGIMSMVLKWLKDKLDEFNHQCPKRAAQAFNSDMRPCGNKIFCYVDCAALSDFHMQWNSKLINFGLTMDDIEFFKAEKPDIKERVTFANISLQRGILRFDPNTCPELYTAATNSFQVFPKDLREITKFERNHDTTHWINSGFEYIWGSYYNQFKQPIFSRLYGDDDGD